MLSVVLPLADGEKGVHHHGKYVTRIRGWKAFWTSGVLPVVRLYSFASATSPSGLLPWVGSVWSVASADLLSHHAQPQSGSEMLNGWMGGWVKVSAAEAGCPTQGHRTQLGPHVQPPRLSWNVLTAPPTALQILPVQPGPLLYEILTRHLHVSPLCGPPLPPSCTHPLSFGFSWSPCSTLTSGRAREALKVQIDLVPAPLPVALG